MRLKCGVGTRCGLVVGVCVLLLEAVDAYAAPAPACAPNSTWDTYETALAGASVAVAGDAGSVHGIFDPCLVPRDAGATTTARCGQIGVCAGG
jgi:hypothetical protein